MNRPLKLSACTPSLHFAFHALFLAGMGICLWLQWNPHSAVVWDTNCVVAFSLASTQIVLYALRYFTRPAGWRPAVAWEGLFFAANFAICLAEFRCGVPYYCFPWIFWILLGLMLVSLPKWLSAVIGGIAIMLYVPMFVGWGRVGSLIFRDWFVQLYPLAFPLTIGLLIRQLLDSNQARSQLIEELQAAKKSLEAARDREGELATLRERERLARDLHDTLGHQLVTLTIQLEAAQRLLAVEPARAAALLTDIQKLSRSSTDDLRRSLDNLRVSGLGQRALGAALQALCAEARQRYTLAVDCQLSANADSFPPTVTEVLWQVAQEGLTNTGRHAQARQVNVNLHLLTKDIILRVTDDGIGLPPGAEDKPGHYGLRGLRERVEGLGGTFTLINPPGGGAALEARLPIIS